MWVGVMGVMGGGVGLGVVGGGVGVGVVVYVSEEVFYTHTLNIRLDQR